MTVTIKKNVDVQATLEAKQLKYQVKRDLSGDVQFENMVKTDTINLTITSGNTTTTSTVTNASNNGWNFAKPANAVFDAMLTITGAPGVSAVVELEVLWKINGVTKASGTDFMSCSVTNTATDFCTAVGQAVASGPAILSSQSAPNVLTKVAKLSLTDGTGYQFLSAIGTAIDTVYGQRNQKVTVMK